MKRLLPEYVRQLEAMERHGAGTLAVRQCRRTRVLCTRIFPWAKPAYCGEALLQVRTRKLRNRLALCPHGRDASAIEALLQLTPRRRAVLAVLCIDGSAVVQCDSA